MSTSLRRLEYTVPGLRPFMLRLTVDADGEASYDAPVNVTAGAVEIGRYRAHLGANEFTALGAALESPPFADLPDHAGRAHPDSTRVVSVTTTRGTAVKYADSLEAADPRLAAVLARLDTLVASVRQHPTWTLRIETTEARRTRDGGELLMRFSNHGSESIWCRHPADPPRSRGEGLFTLGIRPRAEADAITELSEGVVEQIEPVAGAPQASADAPVFELAGGSSATFRVRFRTESPEPRALSVQAIYQNTRANVGGHAAVAGMVYASPVDVPAAP